MAARKHFRYKRKKSDGLLQRLLPCYPWKVKPGGSRSRTAASNNVVMVSLVPVTPAECETQEVVLSTWPNNKLCDMVESAICQANAVTNASMLESIQQDVVAELNKRLPMQVDEQFDFCVVSAELDCITAAEFARDISVKFQLSGFHIEDIMGQDRFSAVNVAFQKSTKILFYITKHFIADDVCSHLVRNTVCLPFNTNITARIVPVVETPEVELPAALCIINKVVLSSPAQFEFAMQRIFNCEVKRATQERKAALIRALDEQRREMVASLVEQKLGVFV